MQKTISYLTADVVVFDHDKVLLIQRKNPPFQNDWALPGGFFDYEDRHVKEAAIRELKEETNISVSDLELVGVFSANWRDPRQDDKRRERIVSVAYWAEFDRTMLDIRAKSDTVGFGWFDVAELLEMPNIPCKRRIAFDHAHIIKEAVECREKQSK